MSIEITQLHLKGPSMSHPKPRRAKRVSFRLIPTNNVPRRALKDPTP